MIDRKICLKGAISQILAAFGISLIVSCVMFDHGSLRKGSIVESFNSAVYLNIESKGGVYAGQELNVYKVIRDVPEPSGIPVFKGVQTGKVKITEIFDNGIAKAVVISGKAEKGDIVEIVRLK